MIRCEICPNPTPATVHLTWGLFEGPDGRPRTELYNEADFCMKCFKEVGSKIEKTTPLGTNLMCFLPRPILEHASDTVQPTWN